MVSLNVDNGYVNVSCSKQFSSQIKRKKNNITLTTSLSLYKKSLQLKCIQKEILHIYRINLILFVF